MSGGYVTYITFEGRYNLCDVYHFSGMIEPAKRFP
jgi:hypothetical protein